MINKFFRLTALMACSLGVLFFTSLQSQAFVGETFTKDQLKYTVYSEDKATKTGTVSVEAESTKISGDIMIPAAVENNGYTYSVTILSDSAFRECGVSSIIVAP